MGSKNIDDELHHEESSYQWGMLKHIYLAYKHPGVRPDTTDDHRERVSEYIAGVIEQRRAIIERLNTRVFTPQQARVVGYLLWKSLFGVRVPFTREGISTKDIEVNNISGEQVSDRIIKETIHLIHNKGYIKSCILDPGIYKPGHQGFSSQLDFTNLEIIISNLNKLPERNHRAAASINLPSIEVSHIASSWEPYSAPTQSTREPVLSYSAVDASGYFALSPQVSIGVFSGENRVREVLRETWFERNGMGLSSRATTQEKAARTRFFTTRLTKLGIKDDVYFEKYGERSWRFNKDGELVPYYPQEPWLRLTPEHDEQLKQIASAWLDLHPRTEPEPEPEPVMDWRHLIEPDNRTTWEKHPPGPPLTLAEMRLLHL